MRRREAITAIDAYADGFRDGAAAIIAQLEKYAFDLKNPKHIEVLRRAGELGAASAREVKDLV